MKGKPVRYSYHTSLEWIGEKKGRLSCRGKPDIMIACPPEFGGHHGIWSPEDLFLSSVEVCFMTSFLYLINKRDIILKSYRSESEGFAELVGNVFRFSLITVNVHVGVSSEKDKDIVEKLLKKVPSICVVSKSIKADVQIVADIFVE